MAALKARREVHMGRLLAFFYGVVAYLAFVLITLYAIGFLGDAVVPKSIDSGGGAVSVRALAIDVGLLTLFALQHSVMARSGFKRRWTRLVPEPIERSTYVLVTVLCLALLFWQWRPMTRVVWRVDGAAAVVLTVLFWLGWLIQLMSTFMVSHFDLFGLRQVSAYLRARPSPPLAFVTPLFYRLVRHPLYTGFLLAFWAAPVMTFGHLVFALVTTLYILVAVRFEERDLLAAFGETYRSYQRKTPMLLPFTKR
jgi:protein-S-isoprenylcysteine O-methyltransferase Ste14